MKKTVAQMDGIKFSGGPFAGTRSVALVNGMLPPVVSIAHVVEGKTGRMEHYKLATSRAGAYYKHGGKK